ncbi:MAG: hypothetical protein ACTSR2_00870 [Candidatus Hodarchaeales archaeon]
MTLNETIKKQVAEEATGIREAGRLEFWNDEGQKITIKKASKLIREGGIIVVPGAGAGSYIKVFQLLGFSDVELIESGSSAGDWTLAVKDETGWAVAGQENRFPFYGFRYWISQELKGFSELSDLIDFLTSIHF